MQQTTQTPIINATHQAQACEAIERCAQTVSQALRKAGTPEAQANVILAGIAAAGRTLRRYAPHQRAIDDLIYAREKSKADAARQVSE